MTRQGSSLTAIVAPVVLLLCLLQPSNASVIYDRLVNNVGELDYGDDPEEGLVTRSREMMMVPLFFEVWKRSSDPEDRERFLAALNTYYMIFGRPRSLLDILLCIHIFDLYAYSAEVIRSVVLFKSILEVSICHFTVNNRHKCGRLYLYQLNN